MDANNKSLYEILQVPPTATVDELKKAYRRLAMECHPDKTDGDKEKESQFKQVNHAYHVLSDPEQRKEYDMLGKTITSIADFNMANVDDLMRDIFSDMIFTEAHFLSFDNKRDAPNKFDFTYVYHDGISRSRSKTPDPEYIDLTVNINELYYGCKRAIQYDILDMCENCHPHKVNTRQTIRCMQCHGKGTMPMNIFMHGKCSACAGAGMISLREKPCSTCNGSHYVTSHRSTTLSIPRGVHDKYEFVLKGKGSYDTDGGHYKDIIVTVSHELPSGIRVDAQSNVHADLNVTLVDLICGFEKEIYLYDGPVVVSSKECICPTDPIRVEKKGLPKYKDTVLGDLFVHLIVSYPPIKTMVKLRPIFMKLFKRTEVVSQPASIILS